MRSLVQRVFCGSSLGRVVLKGSLCGSRGVERSCDKRGEAHGMESQAGGKAKKSAGSSGALPSNPKAAKKLKGVKKLFSSDVKGKKRLWCRCTHRGTLQCVHSGGLAAQGGGGAQVA